MKEIEKLESEIAQKQEELNELLQKIGELKDIEVAKKYEECKYYVGKFLHIDNELYMYVNDYELEYTAIVLKGISYRYGYDKDIVCLHYNRKYFATYDSVIKEISREEFFGKLNDITNDMMIKRIESHLPKNLNE